MEPNAQDKVIPWPGPVTPFRSPNLQPIELTALLDARRKMYEAAITYGKSWAEDGGVFIARNRDFTNALVVFDNLLIEASYRGIKV